MQHIVNERENIIKQIRDFFTKTDVRRVFLFGSFARDESISASDVDLLMEVDNPIGYLKIIEYKLALEEFIHRKVDLFTPKGISPKIHPYIRKDLTLIYENSR
ncbi:MAG: nucleotidyltransferase domain-containing protein [Desulfobacterales bacterium]|nr:nucleotidyltransferase domain-containing protein [Desulfobacterales bacterium]MBF0398674.1 nucleotidyltransferase domain-containing protein [Desulfobacterales bacterium]